MKLNHDEVKTLMAVFLELENTNSLRLKNKWGTKLVTNIWQMYDELTKAYEGYAYSQIDIDDEVEIRFGKSRKQS